MPINQFVAPRSPLDAINGALGVAKDIYGMQHAAAAQKMLAAQQANLEQKTANEATTFDQQQEQYKQQNDPTSEWSKASQNLFGQAADYAAKTSKDPKIIEQASALKNLALPGPTEVDLDTMQETPHPGLSALAIAHLSEAPLIKLAIGQMAADSKTAGFNFRDSQLDKRQEFQGHKATTEGIKKDKILSDAVVKAGNLANAINNVEKSGVITPQDMSDIQSIAITNMGVQGGSSAHERAERYAKQLNIEVKKVEQFLSGNMANIGQDNPLYDRFKTIMQLEANNFKDRAAKRLEVLSGGYKSMYENHPDWAKDLDNTKLAVLNQFPSFDTPTLDKLPGGSAAAPPEQPGQSSGPTIHPETVKSAAEILRQRKAAKGK